ncbi:twin-arginine translocase TatA/TatE family subunit [Falsiroseomonas stagni]|uniref:Sec-independent protein translocase protein TatA n=1 Tax=Falsiroseomonas stagni DSM 19981 TaxID=1123062 RepID=A0A1I3Y1J8_9PROT|nr:twin-arginine translocase TatA/TatE family subunit [Falsiroseomonas stagni]SFK25630.1 sec-independent protein translocase protein TatA [Falsiroseomonas stagni DSM 19981]
MGSFSIWHWLVVLLVILLLFGSGKISGLMGDLAKGIKSFKQNMKEDDVKDASMAADPAAQTPAQPAGSIAAPGAPQGAQTTGTAQAANPSRPAA